MGFRDWFSLEQWKKRSIKVVWNKKLKSLTERAQFTLSSHTLSCLTHFTRIQKISTLFALSSFQAASLSLSLSHGLITNYTCAYLNNHFCCSVPRKHPGNAWTQYALRTLPRCRDTTGTNRMKPWARGCLHMTGGLSCTRRWSGGKVGAGSSAQSRVVIA